MRLTRPPLTCACVHVAAQGTAAKRGRGHPPGTHSARPVATTTTSSAAPRMMSSPREAVIIRAATDDAQQNEPRRGGGGRPSSSAGDPGSPSAVSSCCQICGEVVGQLHAARCAHVACLACWTQWLETTLECPFCRQRCRLIHLKEVPARLNE